jgi:glutathionylspermidine synthase
MGLLLTLIVIAAPAVALAPEVPENIVSASGWAGIGANIGAISLIAWLVRHTFQHTIPRLADQFAKSLEDTRKSFTEALDKQHLHYMAVVDRLRDDSKAERREFIETIDKLRQDSKESLNKIDDVRRELAILASAFKDRDPPSNR